MESSGQLEMINWSVIGFVRNSLSSVQLHSSSTMYKQPACVLNCFQRKYDMISC